MTAQRVPRCDASILGLIMFIGFSYN